MPPQTWLDPMVQTLCSGSGLQRSLVAQVNRVGVTGRVGALSVDGSLPDYPSFPLCPLLITLCSIVSTVLTSQRNLWSMPLRNCHCIAQTNPVEQVEVLQLSSCSTDCSLFVVLCMWLLNSVVTLRTYTYVEMILVPTQAMVVLVSATQQQ